MSTSDASWFKKFLGEDTSAKALRERLEEATALLASKDEALVEQERRLTDATALAQRETDSARQLEARVRDLTETVADTDLSRSVTVELLKQAEAQATQMSDALAAERAKLIAANHAKVKAEANGRTLAAQVQKLESQVAEWSSKVTSLEQERASAHEAKAMLETALARSERRREGTLAELSESRATGEKLSIACEDREARLHALASQLEDRDDALRHAKAESMRCRNASAELTAIAASALYAAVGHGVPVALRVGLRDGVAGVSSTLGMIGHDATAAQVVTTLERWFSDAGVPVTLRNASNNQILIELKGSGSAGDSASLAMGYWIAGLTMQRLSVATDGHYKLSDIEANESGAKVTLELMAKARAAE